MMELISFAEEPEMARCWADALLGHFSACSSASVFGAA